MNCRELIKLLVNIGEDDLPVHIQVNGYDGEDIEDGTVLDIADERSVIRHLDGVFIIADDDN
jgi:hypothetical protein